MKPMKNGEGRVQNSAAWRERALRGSHRIAHACQNPGDTSSAGSDPLLHHLDSALRRPLLRPNRSRFIRETRYGARTVPTTRKIQSA